ncbi:dynein intermediate chain 2, ciliary-like [Lycorma delicatula]|uniref:dynein intermediate chain 2, ciliary-like n=1 Tax=Lycorma delicatula TaxID=130591 RepID=UPI003F511BE7
MPVKEDKRDELKTLPKLTPLSENNEKKISSSPQSNLETTVKSVSFERKQKCQLQKNNLSVCNRSLSNKRNEKSNSSKRHINTKLLELKQKFQLPKEQRSRKGTQSIPVDIFKKNEYLHIKDEAGLQKNELEPSSHEIEKFFKGEYEEKNIRVTNIHVIRDLLVRPNKYTVHLNRCIKMTQYLNRPFLVMDEQIDLTPKPAVKPGDPNWIKNPLMFRFSDEKSDEFNPDYAVVGVPSRASLSFDRNITKPYDEDLYSSIMGIDYDSYSLLAPSMYYLVYPKEAPLNKGSISLRIMETPEIILMNIISRASSVEDREGKEIAKSNELQIHLNKRLRKTVSNYVQTDMKHSTMRTKETQLSRKLRANSYSYISNWYFYDTIEEMKIKTVTTLEKKYVGKIPEIFFTEIKSQYKPIIIMKNFKVDRLNWFRTGMIMERLLLSNNAMHRQLIFHDLLKSDPLKPDIEYKYNLQRLWSLKTDKTKGKTVTSMSWNILQPDILAVGYGKYSFTERKSGLVCIWNNKNLAHPEREYEFQHPVTCVRFGRSHPSILAIAFYSGLVSLINITRHQGIKVVAESLSPKTTLIYPVWQVAWLFKPEINKERVIECKADGSVFEYTKAHLHEKKMVMRISKMKEIVKGISHPKRCLPYVLPLVTHPAVLCIALNPKDTNEYFLGSDEGAVYKCSLRDAHQHMEMFLAHNGPVYTIQFHPACSKIFLTCGADWYIRVWADGIFTPLLTMISGMLSIESACWFHNHPTIIAGITGNNIELWDISRKINLPQAVIVNPNGKLNTSMVFSECGNNMCVGDEDGNVHVYTFKDMPFSPSNPDMVLALVLLKALVPCPILIEQLKKLGSKKHRLDEVKN